MRYTVLFILIFSSSGHCLGRGNDTVSQAHVNQTPGKKVKTKSPAHSPSNSGRRLSDSLLIDSLRHSNTTLQAENKTQQNTIEDLLKIKNEYNEKKYISPGSLIYILFFEGIVVGAIAFLIFNWRKISFRSPKKHEGNGSPFQPGSVFFYSGLPEKNEASFSNANITKDRQADSVFVFTRENNMLASFKVIDDNDTIAKMIFDSESFLTNYIKIKDIDKTTNLHSVRVSKAGRVAMNNEQQWGVIKGNTCEIKFVKKEATEKGDEPAGLQAPLHRITFYLPLLSTNKWSIDDISWSKNDNSVYRVTRVDNSQANIEFTDEPTIKQLVENREFENTAPFCQALNSIPHAQKYSGIESIFWGTAIETNNRWEVKQRISIKFYEHTEENKNEGTIKQPLQPHKPLLPNFYIGLPEDNYFSTYGVSAEHKPGVTLFKFYPISETEAEFELIDDEMTRQWIKSTYTDKIKPACNLSSYPSPDTRRIRIDKKGLVKKQGENWKIDSKAYISFE